MEDPKEQPGCLTWQKYVHKLRRYISVFASSKKSWIIPKQKNLAASSSKKNVEQKNSDKK